MVAIQPLQIKQEVLERQCKLEATVRMYGKSYYGLRILKPAYQTQWIKLEINHQNIYGYKLATYYIKNMQIQLQIVV